eukprot:TRINITY_DN60427_c0_g1_i1.p1 TRINITY_DN60427_c0_g1~~TRINITY_DN60427_c0_g1_i1.p1  ORF type:complete len:493 (-),score=30.76 TRINITY_DN60427_c0_g1_i1:152-1600(-)
MATALLRTLKAAAEAKVAASAVATTTTPTSTTTAVQASPAAPTPYTPPSPRPHRQNVSYSESYNIAAQLEHLTVVPAMGPWKSATLSEAHYTTWGEDILQYIRPKLPSKELVASLHDCRNKLQAIIRTLPRQVVGPDPRLFMFGSCANGLIQNTSDLDLSLQLTPEVGNEGVSHAQITEILGHVFKKLYAHENIRGELVARAAVPVIQGTFGDIEFDITMSGFGVRNSALLYQYAYACEYLRPLVVFLKNWAKTRGLHGAKFGYMSSYSYTLLAISFLLASETTPYVPITSLGPPGMGPAVAPDVHFGEKQKQMLGQLVHQFFHYYLNYFEHETMAACLRTSSGIMWRRQTNDDMRGRGKKFVIEDPYETHLNTARHMWPVQYNRVVAELQNTLDLMNQGASMDTILQQRARSMAERTELVTPGPEAATEQEEKPELDQFWAGKHFVDQLTTKTAAETTVQTTQKNKDKGVSSELLELLGKT